MGPEWCRSIGVDSTTNLNDYERGENYCNTVVYTHKWYLKPKTKKRKQKDEWWLIKKLSWRRREKKGKRKDASTITIDIENSIILGKHIDYPKESTAKAHNEIHCTKCTCCKTKTEKFPKKQQRNDENDVEVDKKRVKKFCVCELKDHKVQELYRRIKAMDSSAKESIASSVNNNTIDDLTNNSISCSLSDLSNQKPMKPEYNKKTVKVEKPKVHPSDSFEALAAEIAQSSGNATIKLHLMNDRDKNVLTHSLTYPIVNAIRECVTENGNQQEMYNEIKTVQNLVLNHAEKLDGIADRLSFIESALKTRSANSQKTKSKAPSTLELLSEDIPDEYNEEKTCGNRKTSDRPMKLSPVLSADEDNIPKTMGSDLEETGHAGPLIGVRQNSQKTPTRFCWTGAGC